MSRVPTVRLRVYPDDCDAQGHVNQAAFLRLFERARWEALALGPGTDVFTRAGTWPAIRSTSVEYFAPAFPGELLRFDLGLTHLGRTSFSLAQIARRDGDGTLVAAGQFLAVCIDRQGRPALIPGPVTEFLGVRPAAAVERVCHFPVGAALVTAEMAGDGPACLLVHGFPLDRMLWRAQVVGLEGWRRIAPDLRGFGLSDPPPAAWTLADYADCLARVLDALGVKRAVLCGLSMGGYVVFEFWRRHRDRVRALVLASTRADPDAPEARERRDAMIELITRDGPGALVELMVPKLLAPATLRRDPLVAAQLGSMIRGASPSGLIASLVAMRDRADATPLLGGIDVPTLVVAGAEDALVTVDSQIALAAMIRDAGLEVIPDAGHLAPLERPVEFNRAVTAFLDSLR